VNKGGRENGVMGLRNELAKKLKKKHSVYKYHELGQMRRTAGDFEVESRIRSIPFNEAGEGLRRRKLVTKKLKGVGKG